MFPDFEFRTSLGTSILLSNWKRDFCYYGYTILKSDLINNMDHTHILGIEPSLVILSLNSIVKH